MAPARDARDGAASPTAEGSELSPEESFARLERFRQSGIRIDREGRFWHEGEPVRHEGLRRALFRWLDRLPPPDGRYILRLDEQRFVYLEVEDTPLCATSLRWAGETPMLGLTDGSEEPLDPESLTTDDAGTVRCRVRSGRLEARLATSAAATLSERIESTPAGPLLRCKGRSVLLLPAGRST
jgi:hypothetical protein